MNAVRKHLVPVPKGTHPKTSPEEATATKGASGHLATPHHHEEGVFSISGAVTGAATGAIAGPPGILAGAVVGAAMGMVIGKALDREDDRQRLHDEDLDREIGVEGGDLGAAVPGQPPARIGAYSVASAGAGSSSPCASEGPMQSLDDD
jgi:hypothetical protein